MARLSWLRRSISLSGASATAMAARLWVLNGVSSGPSGEARQTLGSGTTVCQREPTRSTSEAVAQRGIRMPYALYAIRYATRDARRAEHFIGGDPHDAPMPMDYFSWVAVGEDGRAVVIDTGF